MVRSIFTTMNKYGKSSLATRDYLDDMPNLDMVINFLY